MVVHCSSYTRSMAWNRHVLHRRRLRRLGGHRKVPGRKGKVQKDGREGEIWIFNFYWLNNVEMIWIFNRWIWISKMWKWKWKWWNESELNDWLLIDLFHIDPKFSISKELQLCALNICSSTIWVNKKQTIRIHIHITHEGMSWFRFLPSKSSMIYPSWTWLCFCKAATAAQIQEAEQLLGREHFVEAERVALHHGERTNGSTVNGWRGESSWGKVPIPRQIEEIKMICKRLPRRKIPMVDNGNHVFVLFTATWYWMIGGMWHDSCFVFEFSIVGPTFLLIEICSLQISGRSIFNSPRSAIEDKEADVKADALRSLVKSLIGQAAEIQRYGKCGDQVLDGFLLGWLLLLLQKLTW